MDLVGLHPLPQDRDPCLEVGRLDVGRQAPFEARPQPLLERRDLFRRPVGREHDLLAGLVERVEGVEELLLHPVLALEELDIVDEQHVVGAVALLEALDALVAERVDEVVHEGLARHVPRCQPGRGLADVLGDRLEQVGLAEPGAAVDEERIVGLGRRLGYGECGRVREAVRRADHEQVERVFRVDTRRRARWVGGLARGGGGRSRLFVARANGVRALGDRELNAALVPGHVADAGADQAEEVPLDPLAGEVVRNRDREGVIAQLDAGSLGEPGVKGGLVECSSEPAGDFVPQALGRQLDLVLHVTFRLLSSARRERRA